MNAPDLDKANADDFLISKVELVPEGIVAVPSGEVLLAGFDGQTAFAWVKHTYGETRIMNLVTLPTGGPFRLDTDEGFYPPAHVASFFKVLPAKVKLEHLKSVPHTSAWHVFAWRPLPETIQ